MDLTGMSRPAITGMSSRGAALLCLIVLGAFQLGCADDNPAAPEPQQPTPVTPGPPSGPASNIVLKSSSASSIGVRGSGTVETARLIFEVRDAQGRPVDFAHRATVQFSLTQISGGGAFLDRDTASTDSSGLVAVTLNAGTLAQAVQIRAQAAAGSIFSDLVRVAIHGGRPSPQHFSFATQFVNVAGILQFGILNRVTAFVGDRYGNPVPAGNVVYFTTSGGLIQGSATTDDHGRASVDLVTAEPIPNNVPAFSDSAGIARISIQTVGENETPIIRSGLSVVFSGHTELIVTPPTFSIPLPGSQDFIVTVWDREHHNPLTRNTTITFTATLGTIVGVASFTLPDTRDPGHTSFVFTLLNEGPAPMLVGPDRVKVRFRPVGVTSEPLSHVGDRPAEATVSGRVAGPLPVPARVTVSVTSANGNASTTVSGTVDR